MAIVTNSNKKSQNTINSENLNQLDQVFASKSISSSNSSGTAKENNVEAKEVEIKTVTKPKREYKDTILLNLPKGERNVFKSFCAQHDLTMTDFIYFAMDYVKDKAEAGSISISRGGIKEIQNN
ncbi:MAG: hypothetical protein MJ188_10510 [Treponema sp.]|nr:hypothetical protein [Treponema sp.]